MSVVKKKKKVVAKKKRGAEIQELMSPEAQRKMERRLVKKVMELDEKAEERESYVQTILDANDPEIEDTVMLMVEEFRKMEGPPKLIFEGHTYHAIKGEAELLQRIQTKNFRYISARLLVAWAEWGIRAGGFKLPKHNCAKCGRKVK